MKAHQPWFLRAALLTGLVATFAIPATANSVPFSQTITFTSSFNVFATVGPFPPSPFNYGFTNVALIPSIVGNGVTISSVSVSATGANSGGTINVDWQVFLGPAAFGLPTGAVVGSTTLPETLTPNAATAPTQFDFVVGRLTGQSAGTINFSGSNNFLLNTSSASPVLGGVKAAFTSPLNLSSGLNAQMFVWTEDNSGVNINFSDFSLTVTGTMPAAAATPEPSSLPLVGTGLAGLLFLLRSRRWRLAG